MCIEEEYYLVWLSNLFYINPKLIYKLIRHFGSIQKLYSADCSEAFNMISLNEKLKYYFIRSKNKDKIKEQIRIMKQKNIKLISYYNESYPKNLKEIEGFPLVLYYNGNISSLSCPCIAIVGCRECSSYGQKIAEELSTAFSAFGVSIVSGMARGIDSAAHKASIVSGGNTIGVMGCGLDLVYPEENRELMKQIQKYGCTLSEFPILTKPLGINFPRRNRIISGLCSDIIVVEAKEKSGALITAKYGLEQNRNIYAVPGNINSKTSAGTNELIKDGARLLDNIMTIFEDNIELKRYIIKRGYTIRKRSNKGDNEESKVFDNKDFEKIYKSLISSMNIIDISETTGIEYYKLIKTLNSMEIEGYIKQITSNVYRRN